VDIKICPGIVIDHRLIGNDGLSLELWTVSVHIKVQPCII
jgi:hypothetical protein